MANGRGGRRPGAGRKAGGTNKRTREFRAEVAKSGRSPLEHILARGRQEQKLLARERSERLS